MTRAKRNLAIARSSGPTFGSRKTRQVRSELFFGRNGDAGKFTATEAQDLVRNHRKSGPSISPIAFTSQLPVSHLDEVISDTSSSTPSGIDSSTRRSPSTSRPYYRGSKPENLASKEKVA